MTKIIILTDPHICDEGQTIIGLNPSFQFEKALNHINKYHSNANRLVITGDLTNSGTLSQYNIIRNILKSNRIPTTLMLGNHDNRDNFRKIFWDYPTDPHGFIQAKESISTKKLIFLDTLLGPPDLAEEHFGEICEERYNWLEKQLQTLSKDKIILFMHHPPFNVGFPGMDKIKLKDSDQFMNFIKRFPNLLHVVCGHIHRTISGNVQGKSFSIFKSTCHQMPMQQSSIKSSLSVAEPPAYGMLLINDTDIITHSVDFDFSNLEIKGSNPDQTVYQFQHN